MKLIIDVKKDYYEMLKYFVEHGDKYKPIEIIANGIPYEERPKGEWLIHRIAFHLSCPFCGCNLRALKSEVFEGDYDYNFCPNCGADLRKPNCVRCDHFGDCDGCERSGEE